jgi:hypothetical protein
MMRDQAEQSTVSQKENDYISRSYSDPMSISVFLSRFSYILEDRTKFVNQKTE